MLQQVCLRAVMLKNGENILGRHLLSNSPRPVTLGTEKMKIAFSVMLERSEASQGGASQSEKTPCHPEILRRPDNS